MGPPAPTPGFVFAAIATAFATIAVLVVIIWPFAGTLIRYWASYTPKRIILGDESRGDNGTVEVDSQESIGYWGLFRRVKRIEGLSGLWKGAGAFCVMVLFAAVLYAAIVAVLVVFGLLFPHSAKITMYVAVPVVAILGYFIAIPLRVILIRAVATSKKLWVRQPLKAYRALLNSHERGNPLRLCLLPGLLFATVLADVVQTALGIPRGMNLMRNKFTIVGFVLSVIVNIVMALVVTPFQVAIIRLSLQEKLPTQPIGEEGAALTEAQGRGVPSYQESEGGALAGLDEEVITIRSGQEPYKGLFDCMKTIASEEGRATLWRGWIGLACIFFFSEFPYRFTRLPPPPSFY